MTRLTLTIAGDQHVIVTRRFAASPADVYRAHVEPELLRQWMLGPDGWVMTDCQSDPKPGGKIRFAWSDGGDGGFSLTGEYQVLDPGKRIVHVERMHLPNPTPDNHIETTFALDGAGTLLTLRMTLPDAATRAAMLETGMEDGMEASYARIDPLLLAVDAG